MMESVGSISFARHPVNPGELWEQTKEILRKVYHAVKVFFTNICRTLSELLRCGWRLLQRGISINNPLSASSLSRPRSRRVYFGSQNRIYTQELAPVYQKLSYPKTLKEQLDLYNHLPNEPVPFCRSLVELHRSYLGAKKKPEALKDFNEGLSSSLRFEDLIHLCIRGLVFTSKRICLGEGIADEPHAQQIGPSCLPWYGSEESALYKLQQMRTSFKLLSDAEKELFLDSFYDKTQLVAFTKEGAQLWLDIGKMVSHTLHKGNQPCCDFLQTVSEPYTE